jgi:hypothetical protein
VASAAQSSAAGAAHASAVPNASKGAAHAATTASTSPGKPYFVEFRARSALSYGHTFAVVGRVGQKLTKKNVVGLHPATDSSVPWVIGHLLPVPSETGWSDGDIEDAYIIARYRVLLTSSQFKELSAYVEKLKAESPSWHAVFYNCNAFVGKIAVHLGLQTPSSTMLMPKEYITELKSLNTGRKQQSAAGASTSVR